MDSLQGGFQTVPVKLPLTPVPEGGRRKGSPFTAIRKADGCHASRQGVPGLYLLTIFQNIVHLRGVLHHKASLIFVLFYRCVVIFKCHLWAMPQDWQSTWCTLSLDVLLTSSRWQQVCLADCRAQVTAPAWRR